MEGYSEKSSLATDDLLLKIHGLHRAEFEKAKRSEQIALYLQILVAVAALGSVAANADLLSGYVNANLILYILSMMTLIATVLRFVFSHRTRLLRNSAERARRLLTLVDGLGQKVSQNELESVLKSMTASEEEGKRWEDPDFFATEEERGYDRFADIIQESSFYSEHLYSISARRTWYWFIGATIVSLMTLFGLVRINTATMAVALAQAVIVLLIFLVSSNLLGNALEYMEASRAIGRITDRLVMPGAPNYDENDLIYLWDDYNATVQNTPMIPTRVYNQNEERLAKKYEQKTG